MNTSAFIAKFAEEARDRLKALTAAVLRLEEVPDDGEAIAEVLRECHNLKGSARMLGLLDISQVTHRIEELFVRARAAAATGEAGSGRTPLNATAFDTVFSALDALSLRVEQLASGMTTAVDVTALCDSLAALVSESGEARPAEHEQHTEIDSGASAHPPAAPAPPVP